MAFSGPGTINPNIFPTHLQAAARNAAEQDQIHEGRIKGTNDQTEIESSYKEAKNTWTATMPRDSYKSSESHQSPDGGMRDLAKQRGKS